MPVLYELDKTKPFNRGKKLCYVKLGGMPQFLGHYKGITIWPFADVLDWDNEEKCYYDIPLSPADLNVKGFMFSEKINGDWETSYVIDREHYIKTTGNTPKYHSEEKIGRR